MKKHFLITIMFVMSFASFMVGTNSNPTMSRVRGNQYTPATKQTQSSGSIGVLVPTGIFGTNGSLSLAAQVPNAQAVAIQILSTGIMPVVFSNGTNTYMVEYAANGAVNTSFASGSGNILELANLANAALFLMVDEQDRFLLAGQDDASALPWIRRVTTTGTVDGTFTFTDGSSWTTAGAINKLGTQTSGKIIATGFNGTHSMIARYNLNGSIDSTFGVSGYVVFNGAVSGGETLPISQAVLHNVVIDAQNNIYIAYATTTPSVYVTRLTPTGTVDLTWNSGNPVNLSYLNGSSMQIDQLSMVLDSVGDLVVAVPSGSPTVIKAASIQSATALAGAFVNFTTAGGVFGTDNYALLNMMATSDGSVYFLGSDTTSKKMAIIRCTSAGILDTTFNGTGSNFFYPTGSIPSGYGDSNAGAIAPDGQIFLAGAQLNTGVITPYLSSLYNNQYVSSVPQFPITQEQGTTDISFGSPSIQTSPGVVSPFFGLYRASLQQKAEAVTELASGNILLGMNGYTGVSPLLSDMMLVRLLPTGDVDGTFGLAGQLILPNITGTNEYITSILEDGSTNLYITGYCDSGAIFRKYTSSGMLLWNSDYLVTGYQGLGCGFEGITRALLFLGGPSHTGQINGYLVTDGSVDTSFHALGSSPGQLLTTDFGLDMGSLHNGIVDATGDIFIAYKDTTTGAINVASVLNAAANVIWTNIDVFSTTLISVDNVRISFNNDGNLIVAASVGTDFLITVLDVATGHPTSNYTSPLVIACGTAIQLKQVIGISDDTIVLVGYDGTGDAMLVARVTATGVVDITFDSQGTFPGVASIQVGHQIADYYARVASGITVQSHTGSNQGNLIMSGYEQMFATDATPMVMRVFGEPGTTQVKNSPVSAKIPGTFDLSYNGTGIAQTDIVRTVTNQEVRAIRELTGTQIMTVITDNTTSTSYTQRLNADSTIDTTYGGGRSVPIIQLAGTEIVQNMVFEGSGNILISGSNSISGGYVKRLLPNGTMDHLFGGYNGTPNSSSYPLGTTYGLMDTINACQPLANGDIAIVGSNGGVGAIQMLSVSGKPLTTFGVGGQVTSGVNATSVSVDPSNNMYVSVAYLVGSQTNVRILKLNAATGQLITSFGTDGVIDPAISNIDDSQSLRLVFDGALRPIVAASIGGSSGQVAVQRFTVDGLIDMSFNGGVQSIIPFSPATNVVVTGMVALQNNKILISGYQQDDAIPARNHEFVACINSGGVLDGSFGSATPAGLVTFQVADSVQLARRLITMNVQADGNILLCGGEVPSTNQETPLTFRLYGYPNIQSVPQSSGYVSTLPNVLNKSFNITGIAETPAISNVSQVGNGIVDSFGRTLIGGTTSTGLFVIARYLRNGLLDTIENGGLGFGVGGIATSTIPVVGLSGGEIAVDSIDNVYIGGVSSSNQLLVARFTPMGILDTAHFGVGGIAASISVAHLFSGGFVAVGSDDKPLVSGYSSTGNIVATRFFINGTTDTTFAADTSSIASIAIPSLLSGGSIATDKLNNIYIGGITSSNTMFIAMLHRNGHLNTEAFGVDGIAWTPMITDLVDGGAIALDSSGDIVIGGLTVNQSFVVAKFLPIGQLDLSFNFISSMSGIAYSNPVNLLNVFGNITVDSHDNIVVGGVALNYDKSQSMIVARFTSIGNLDTDFTPVGMATTGSISHVGVGGFVMTDVYDNIFVVGLTDAPGFAVAQMYSGYEIFITDIAILNPSDRKTFYYGNNPGYLIQVLSAGYFAQVITDVSVREAVLSSVADIVESYVLTYSGQPGWNLVWHLYLQLNLFEEDRKALIILFVNSTNQINDFYADLETRINGMKFAS